MRLDSNLIIKNIVDYLDGQIRAACIDQTSWLYRYKNGDLIKSSTDLKLVKEAAESVLKNLSSLNKPVPIQLECPRCKEPHIDEGEFATKPHKTHSCQKCGLNWMPSLQPTVGVKFLPGTKNEQ